MAPSDAARIILAGVARNCPRVLVGNDAKALDLLVRLTGSATSRSWRGGAADAQLRLAATSSRSCGLRR